MTVDFGNVAKAKYTWAHKSFYPQSTKITTIRVKRLKIPNVDGWLIVCDLVEVFCIPAELKSNFMIIREVV